jgi:hypothetical protein
VCFFFYCGGELSRAAIVGDFPELSRTAETVSFALLEPSGELNLRELMGIKLSRTELARLKISQKKKKKRN